MTKIDLSIKAKPFVKMSMVCYHYKTVTNKKGKKRRKRVVSHRATEYFTPKAWHDESAPISSLFYLQAMLLTRLHVSKSIEIAGEATERYDEERKIFISNN